ncbi:MAG: rhodanese-like domain-containing protein [Bacteroidetes bacterium]|nr:MAG: rhodanese-like domain-containing protein [Bacteroidota bacterium]
MNRRTLLIAAGAAALIAAVCLVAQRSSVPALSVQETHAALADTSVFVLDVRTPPEHRAARIAGTALIPLDELGGRLAELRPHAHKRIIVYCRTDNRSGTAAALLRKNGFDAYNMTGGIVRWKAESLPVAEGGSR